MQAPVAWLVSKGTSVFVSLYLGNGSDFYLKGVRPLLRETSKARGHTVGATREQGPAAEVEVAAPPRNGGDLRKSTAFAWGETPCGEGGPVWSTSRTPAPTPAQPSLPAPTLAGGRAATKPSAHAPTSAPPEPRPYFPRLTSPGSASPPRQQLRRHDWLRDVLLSANKRHAVAPVLLGRTKQKQTERAGPEALRGGGGG